MASVAPTGFNASRAVEATFVIDDVDLSQLSKRYDEIMGRDDVCRDRALGGIDARRNVIRHMDQIETTVRSSTAYTRTKPPSFAVVYTQPIKFLGIILRRSQLRSPYIQQQARQVYRLKLFHAP